MTQTHRQSRALVSARPRTQAPLSPKPKPPMHIQQQKPSAAPSLQQQPGKGAGEVRAFQIIPSRTNDPDQTEETLQAAMQGLVLRKPVALEIAGIGANGTKQFLIRATDQISLNHAKEQIRAYAPQVEIRPLHTYEPFHLYDGETVSAQELKPGAAAYLPMRDMKKTDPLRGILASLTLPPDMRAVAQIALTPATPTWSHNNVRKAVEHPLDKEKQRHRDAMMLSSRIPTPSIAGLVFLTVVFVGFLLYNRFPSALPQWIVQACTQLFFDGQLPHFMPEHAIIFYGGLASLFLLPVLVGIGVSLLKNVFAGPIYNQLQVVQKTGQMAYRVCLRLYVFGPGSYRSLNSLFWRYHTLIVNRDRQRFIRMLVRGGSLCLCAGGHLLFLCLLLPIAFGIRQCCSTRIAHFPCVNKVLAEADHTLFTWITRWRFLRRRVNRHLRNRKSLKSPHRIRLYLRLQRHWKEEHAWRRIQKQRRLSALESLIASYRQFDTASAGYFVPKSMSDAQARQLVTARWPEKVARSQHYITADFLSRAWYLPKTTMFELPGIEQKRARTLLIPTSLIAPRHTRILGVSRHAGYAHPFALPPGFLAHHTLIGGKTGEGKSTLMIHIAQEAMANGALCVLDPHGDLAHDILRSVPQHRLEDVVFIDLGDHAYSVGLNPLDVTLGRDRDLVVSALVETFKKIWESGWGTRMEAPFRSAIMTLVEANEALVREGKAEQQYTILDVFQLLLDDSFCEYVRQSVRDVYLHRFWLHYYHTLDERQQRERIDPIITKLLQFESKVARRVLGQGRSTINLSEFIRDRKIIVIRLAQSEAGLAAPILGSTLLSLLMVALREQSVLAPEDRIGTSIIIDEFQTLPGADYAQLLAELRKFGGAAVLATQSFEYLAKLNPHLQATTMANVKQYFMFRLSADDARLIARELGDVTDEDILNLDVHSCYVKLIHQQQQQPTFSLQINRPSLADRAAIDLIRTQSRRFSRLAADVDHDLLLAMARALQATPPQQEETQGYQQTQSKKTGPKPPKQRKEKSTVHGIVVDSTIVGQEALQQTADADQPQPNKPKGNIHFTSPREKRQQAAKNHITSFDIHPETEIDNEEEEQEDNQ